MTEKPAPKPQELLPLPRLDLHPDDPEPEDAKLEYRRMYRRWDRPVRWREDDV